MVHKFQQNLINMGMNFSLYIGYEASLQKCICCNLPLFIKKCLAETLKISFQPTRNQLMVEMGVGELIQSSFGKSVSKI